ncbi:MAG: DUF4437 domain-containing protein [Myxococcota bacterium]
MRSLLLVFLLACDRGETPEREAHQGTSAMRPATEHAAMRPAMEHAAMEHAAMEHAATARPATERSATERPVTEAATERHVVRVSEVDWQALNPARGDASPLAGTLWGDRNGAEATGFLFRPVDGFRSPPHIHNVTYRGVVIRGVVHNDDPDAEELWMPAGSFWTQPKGDVHITAARGDNTLAYIEIDEGPYLVWPVERAFQDGESPRNVAASEIAWTAETDVFVNGRTSGGQVAHLWGEPTERGGLLLRLPAGQRATLSGSTFRAVVIRGMVQSAGPLAPGSYFQSNGAEEISCDEVCVLYVRHEARFRVALVE